MKGVLAAVLFTAGLYRCAFAALIGDGGFELAASGGESAWPAAKGTYRYVTGEGRDGSAAVRFDVKKGDGYFFPQQKVSIEPSSRYRFEAWARTKDIKGRAAGAALYAGFIDAGGKHVGGGSSEGLRGTHGEWTRLVFELNTPTNAATLAIGPYLTRRMTGTVWFDDICVTRLRRPVLGPLASSAYRETENVGEVVFASALTRPQNELAAEGFSAVFELPLPGGGLRKVPAAVTDGFARIAMDVSALPPGESTVSLVLMDAAGNIVERQSLAFRRETPPADLPVRIDRYKRLIVEGKPFLPVGIYLSHFSDIAVADLKESPFNCVMCYQKLTREQLDTFHTAGLKVIYSIKDVYRGRPGCPGEIADGDAEAEDAWVERHVRSLKDHPAILAWYLNDELGEAWIARLRRRYELMRHVDPGHPTYAVLYQVERLREYIGTCDAIGSDPYPVAHKDGHAISMVAEWTCMTREAMFGGKPVWQVPQIFDWGAYKSWKGFKTRAPTENEMRNMAWQCIVAGADGVVPYNYSGLRKMDKKDPFKVQWAKVCRAYGDIRQYSEVLLSKEMPPSVGKAPEGLHVRTWRYRGCDWLLAVSTKTEPAKADISVAGHGLIEVDINALGVEMRRLGDGTNQ